MKMERLEKLEDDIPLPDVFLSAAPEYCEKTKNSGLSKRKRKKKNETKFYR